MTTNEIKRHNTNAAYLQLQQLPSLHLPWLSNPSAELLFAPSINLKSKQSKLLQLHIYE